MFTPQSAMEAARSQETLRASELVRHQRHYSEIVSRWFRGLDAYLRPLRVEPLDPQGFTHQEAVVAWSWGVQVLPPIVGFGPVGDLVVRLFANGRGNAAWSVGFTPNRFHAAWGAWDPLEAWARIEQFADLTLEPEGYESTHCSRIYAVLPEETK